MKDLIVVVGLTILGVAIVLNTILGDTDSMKNSSKELGEKMIQDVQTYTQP